MDRLNNQIIKPIVSSPFQAGVTVFEIELFYRIANLIKERFFHSAENSYNKSASLFPFALAVAGAHLLNRQLRYTLPLPTTLFLATLPLLVRFAISAVGSTKEKEKAKPERDTLTVFAEEMSSAKKSIQDELEAIQEKMNNDDKLILWDVELLLRKHFDENKRKQIWNVERKGVLQPFPDDYSRTEAVPFLKKAYSSSDESVKPSLKALADQFDEVAKKFNLSAKSVRQKRDDLAATFEKRFPEILQTMNIFQGKDYLEAVKKATDYITKVFEDLNLNTQLHNSEEQHLITYGDYTENKRAEGKKAINLKKILTERPLKETPFIPDSPLADLV